MFQPNPDDLLHNVFNNRLARWSIKMAETAGAQYFRISVAEKLDDTLV